MGDRVGIMEVRVGTMGVRIGTMGVGTEGNLGGESVPRIIS